MARSKLSHSDEECSLIKLRSPSSGSVRWTDCGEDIVMSMASKLPSISAKLCSLSASASCVGDASGSTNWLSESSSHTESSMAPTDEVTGYSWLLAASTTADVAGMSSCGTRLQCDFIPSGEELVDSTNGEMGDT